MIKNKHTVREKGSVLVLVLWALGLLSVFAIYLGLGARSKIDFLDRMDMRSKTFHLAEAGIKQAVAGIGNFDKKKSYLELNDICSNKNRLFSRVEFENAVLQLGYEYSGEDFSRGDNIRKIMYGISDEQSKLNLNTVENNELRNLLIEAAGIDANRADEIAAAVIDWRDNDSMSLAKGAEDKYYLGLKNGYECKDYRFQAIEELRYVKGMDYNVFKAIEPYITVYGSGEVNINTASSKVLKALGLSDRVTDKILSYRCADDEIEATGDDKAFVDTGSIVAKFSQAVSLSASEVAELSNIVASGRLTVLSNMFLIQSKASLKNRDDFCVIKCVFEKDMTEESRKTGVILSWRMDYLKEAVPEQAERDYEVW